MDTTWIHGNALVAESPEALASLTHSGWGTVATFPPGATSWFHIPLPTPDVSDGRPATLTSLYLAFECESGHIAEIDIYDGGERIAVFDNGTKPTLVLIDAEPFDASTHPAAIPLPEPSLVRRGVGLSFWFLADSGFDSRIGNASLTVYGAGADFQFESIILEEIENAGRTLEAGIVKLAG